MPKTYVVHLGNSKELMEVAEDSFAKKVLREQVRESLGVQSDDILFGIINSKPSITHSSCYSVFLKNLLNLLFLRLILLLQVYLEERAKIYSSEPSMKV